MEEQLETSSVRVREAEASLAEKGFGAGLFLAIGSDEQCPAIVEQDEVHLVFLFQFSRNALAIRASFLASE